MSSFFPEIQTRLNNKRRKILRNNPSFCIEDYRKDFQRICGEGDVKDKAYHIGYFSEKRLFRARGDKERTEEFGLLKIMEGCDHSRLRGLYNKYFGNTKRLIGRNTLYQFLIDIYNGKKPGLERRMEEINHLDESYIFSTTRFFLLNGISIPCDIMMSILSFLSYDYDLICGLGLVNYSFYLLLLSTWNSFVVITYKNFHDIPIIVLRNLTRLVLPGGLSDCDLKYLHETVYPSRVKEVYFGQGCSLENVSFYLSYMEQNEWYFPFCEKIVFPKFTLSQKPINERITLPSRVFGKLKAIDNYQPHFFHFSETRGLSSLAVGSRVKHSIRTKDFLRFGENHMTSYERRTSPRSEDGYRSTPIESEELKNGLFNTGGEIQTLTWRIVDEVDWKTYEQSILALKSVEKIDLYISHFFDLTNREEGKPWKLRTDEENVRFRFLELPNLKEFSLDGYLGRIFGRKTLPQSFPSLQYPNISKVRLKNLSFPFCESALEKFPNLEVLDISYGWVGLMQPIFDGFDIQEEFESFFQKFVSFDEFDRKKRRKKFSVERERETCKITVLFERNVLKFRIQDDRKRNRKYGKVRKTVFDTLSEYVKSLVCGEGGVWGGRIDTIETVLDFRRDRMFYGYDRCSTSSEGRLKKKQFSKDFGICFLSNGDAYVTTVLVKEGGT